MGVHYNLNRVLADLQKLQLHCRGDSEVVVYIGETPYVVTAVRSSAEEITLEVQSARGF